jgi:tRNA G46 methylase TrmB
MWTMIPCPQCRRPEKLNKKSAMKSLLALLGFVLLQPAVLVQDGKPRDMHEMHRLHQEPKAYMAMLDDPPRDAYQKPHEVITALDLRPGEYIADIGAG